MEHNLNNQWFRDFSGLELTSNTVVLKAKVYSSSFFFVLCELHFVLYLYIGYSITDIEPCRT
ncbi:hypothetical protein GHT06_005374 [Daphnia sinensis]|uniref:Uncharacterized protein n=1 Tax=Daphnia sinensis TaxID=1820382 RepID=A0AAD5KF54_9CRUS|nr:hypothetical protein GHT06_005374 [Daphnia sinensis]